MMKRVKPSALTLLRVMLGFIVAVVVLAPVVGVVALRSPEQWGDAPRIITIAVWLVLIVCALAILSPTYDQFRREELQRGYTTLPSAHINVDTVDPRTGATLRKAGEPILTRAEYRAARAAARGRA